MPETNSESSSKRAEAARRNGAKSRGPVTPEGKARSSRNATRHGLCSDRQDILLLPGESPDELNALTVSLYEKIRPTDEAEAALVDHVIASEWRYRRAIDAETVAIRSAAFDILPQLREQYESMNERVHVAHAFVHLLENSKAFALLLRYQNSCRRAYRSALQDLAALRKLSAAADQEQPVIPPPTAQPIDSLPTFPIDPTPEPAVPRSAEPSIPPPPIQEPNEPKPAKPATPPISHPTPVPPANYQNWPLNGPPCDAVLQFSPADSSTW